jgi:hypothetical protein
VGGVLDGRRHQFAKQPIHFLGGLAGARTHVPHDGALPRRIWLPVLRGVRAGRALHADCPRWLDLASLDADLQRVIAAWGGLPEAIRTAIADLIGP